MAFDEQLAERVRELLRGRAGLTERRMFGGLCFLLGGHLFIGVDKTDLIVRVPPAKHNVFLRRAGAREFDLARRRMRGWLLVSWRATRTAGGLAKWVDAGLSFAESQLAKQEPKPPR